MLDTLKLVCGAVASQDIVQALTHVHFYKGRIQGGDGRVSIDAPLPEMKAHELTVPGKKLVLAVRSCDKEPTLKVTDKSVMIAEGHFRVRLPLLPNDSFPRMTPDPLTRKIKNPILPALRAVRPYIASDSSRPWSIGAWIDPQRVYATNNTIIVRHPIKLFEGTKSSINLPVYAVDELLRIGLEPSAYGLRKDGLSITFYFDDWWLQAQTLTTEWPVGTIEKIFSIFKRPKMEPLPKGFKQAVTKLLPFCVDEKFPVICTGPDGVCTEEGEQGAEMKGYKLNKAKYNGVMLQLALQPSTHMLVPDKPETPFQFCGDGIEGMMSGLRL
jgi:hypothetical protein